MDISSIIYAAIGGGGGAALGSFLSTAIQKMRSSNDAEENEKPPISAQAILTPILTVIGIFLLGSMYKNMTLPRIIPLDDRELIAEVPLYGVIKKQSPDDYKRLIIPVDRAARNGKTDQTTLNEGRIVLFELIGEKTKTANAETLRDMERLAQSQNTTYKAKAPHICTLIMNAEPYPALDEYFSEKDIELDQEITEKLFTAPPRPESFVANLELGKAKVEPLFLSAMKEVGVVNIRPEINGSEAQKMEHQKICDLAVLFSKKTMELGDDDFLNVKAYMTSLQ